MSADLTPAQQRQAHLARLKAKNKLKQDAQAIKATRKATSFVNTTPNQPSSSRNAASGVQAAAKDLKDTPAPLPRDSRLGKYFEYDLSKLHNSKGGFLTEEDGDARQTMIAIQREKARERARIAAGEEPPINPETSPRCAICGSLELDHEFLRVFGVRICKKDKKDHPEQYSLLTKTECREDYLLTESELRDPSLLPHLLKPNPHASNYSNMMLYLRIQVEEVAWKKWGGPEGLDTEWEKREDIKRERKVKKFEDGLKALRRKTKHNAYQVRQDAEHQHEYEDIPTDDPAVVQRTCVECGHTLEVEVMKAISDIKDCDPQASTWTMRL